MNVYLVIAWVIIAMVTYYLFKTTQQPKCDSWKNRFALLSSKLFVYLKGLWPWHSMYGHNYLLQSQGRFHWTSISKLCLRVPHNLWYTLHHLSQTCDTPYNQPVYFRFKNPRWHYHWLSRKAIQCWGNTNYFCILTGEIMDLQNHL